MDEEKSKHVSLAQQNGFGPAFLLDMMCFFTMAGESHLPRLTPAIDWIDSLTGLGGLLSERKKEVCSFSPVCVCSTQI